MVIGEASMVMAEASMVMDEASMVMAEASMVMDGASMVMDMAGLNHFCRLLTKIATFRSLGRNWAASTVPDGGLPTVF